MIKRVLKSVKSILFADPKLLYKEEIQLVNKPFHFKGENEQGILLVHGWTSTPYELRRLGTYLNEQGYTVYAPILTGHGTMPKDLEGVHWTDWLLDIKKAYEKLKQENKKVYVCGTSIGSNLAILLAAENPDIAGLVLMATPYKIKFEFPAVLFARFLLLFRKYNKKHYPPTFGLSSTITRLISYQTYPIRSALEVHEIIQKSVESLPKITQPCLIIQSAHDHIVQRKSLEEIYKKINSKIKKKVYIPRAYHTFISDIKVGHIFENILEFIKEN